MPFLSTSTNSTSIQTDVTNSLDPNNTRDSAISNIHTNSLLTTSDNSPLYTDNATLFILDSFSFRNISSDNFTRSYQENTTDLGLLTTPVEFGMGADESRFIIISLIITAFVTVLGLFGNSFNVIIMRKEPYKSSSYGIYLTALAVADMMSLLLLSFDKDSMRYLFGRDLKNHSDSVCKLFSYLYAMTRLSSASCIVFICFERFLAVWFPLKAKIFLSVRTAVVIISGIFLVSNVIGILHGVSFVLENGVCLPTSGGVGRGTFLKVVGLIYYFVYTFIPTVTLLFLAPLIIIKIYRQQTVRQQLQVTSSGDSREITRLAAILVCTVLSYIILVTSGVIGLFVLTLGLKQDIHADSVSLWVRVVKEVIWTMEQLNYSGNFFIYGLASVQFRQQFVKIFRDACKTCRS